MKQRQAGENFGVEFFDLDVNKITEDELAYIKNQQDQQGIVFFRDQDLTCEQHIEFAQRWGEIVVNRFFEKVEGYQEIAMVRKEPQHKTVVGEEWHTDHSYDQEPAKGSILYAREVPSTGGDTLFASMYLAYEGLSDDMKKTVESLKAVHSSRHVFSKQAVKGSEPEEDRFHNFENAVQDSVHPVVITHPESGKKSLYVNPGFTVKIEGWNEDESAALLQELYTHSLNPKHMTRFKWQKDSIAFWDNRATWHQAQNDYPNETRLMHRITLKGCPISA